MFFFADLENVFSERHFWKFWETFLSGSKLTWKWYLMESWLESRIYAVPDKDWQRSPVPRNIWSSPITIQVKKQIKEKHFCCKMPFSQMTHRHPLSKWVLTKNRKFYQYSSRYHNKFTVYKTKNWIWNRNIKILWRSQIFSNIGVRQNWTIFSDKNY